MAEMATLSPLFTWRSAIASGVGPQDYELTIAGKGVAEPTLKKVSGLLQRAIAHVLATHMNERGASCFPAIATIAMEAACSERAVQFAIRALEESGWLIVRQGGNQRGNRRTSNTYRATFPSGVLEVIEEEGGRVNVVHLSEARRVIVDPSTGERGTPERDSNKKKADAPSGKTADGLDLDRVYRWLDVLGVGYAEDRSAFFGELLDRFGIEADSALGARLLDEAQRKAGMVHPALDEGDTAE